MANKSHNDSYAIYQGRALELSDLPNSYGKTGVYLMAVGPCLAHVIWEIGADDINEVKRQCGNDLNNCQSILKFHDITESVFNGKHAHAFFEVIIDLKDKKLYVPLQKAGKSYVVELGFKTEDGQFFSIARSNVAETPRDKPECILSPDIEPESCEPEETNIDKKALSRDKEDFAEEPISDDQICAKEIITEKVNQATRTLQKKDRPGGAPDNRYPNNRYIDAIEVVESSVSMASDWPRIGARPPFRLHAGAFSDDSGHDENVDACDLTELSEKGFLFGVSSN